MSGDGPSCRCTFNDSSLGSELLVGLINDRRMAGQTQSLERDRMCYNTLIVLASKYNDLVHDSLPLRRRQLKANFYAHGDAIFTSPPRQCRPEAGRWQFSWQIRNVPLRRLTYNDPVARLIKA